MEVVQTPFFHSDHFPEELTCKIIDKLIDRQSLNYAKNVTPLSLTSRRLNEICRSEITKFITLKLSFKDFHMVDEVQNCKRQRDKWDYFLYRCPDFITTKFAFFKNQPNNNSLQIKQTNYFTGSNPCRSIPSTRLNQDHCFTRIYKKEIFTHLDNEGVITRQLIPSKHFGKRIHQNLKEKPIALPKSDNPVGKALEFLAEEQIFITQSSEKVYNIYKLKENSHHSLAFEENIGQVFIAKKAIVFSNATNTEVYIYRYANLNTQIQLVPQGKQKILNYFNECLYLLETKDLSPEEQNAQAEVDPNAPAQNAHLPPFREHYLTKFCLADRTFMKVCWKSRTDQMTLHPFKNYLVLSETFLNSREMQFRLLTTTFTEVHRSSVHDMVQPGEPIAQPVAVDNSKPLLFHLENNRLSVVKRSAEVDDYPFRMTTTKLFPKEIIAKSPEKS